jgi:hypothetical protein
LDDYDLTKDKMFDIMNYDKTQYDLKVTTFVSDYSEFASHLVQQLAKDAVEGVGGQEESKKRSSSQNIIR